MNFWTWVSVLLTGFLSSFCWAAVEFKEAEITTIKNMVEHDPGTGAAPAQVNEKIYEKSKVSTAAASMAELTFADSSITRMGANTQFSFQSKERLVKLEQGTVLIHTPPGNGGAKVEAGGVTAAVTGTTFMASRDTSGNVMFVLLEGQGGLKVTVGGTTTVIRPGQAASVGAEVVKESSAAPAAEKPAAGPSGGSASPGDEKAGGASSGSGGTGAGGGTPAATVGGDSGSAAPAPTTPKIQVFDVDVKKVVTSSPLIVEFKAELPSVSKIEKVVETQQIQIQEGKLEKTETEVVLIKNKDGDVMVGAPRVEKEETVVVNKKVDQVGDAVGQNELDVETAAGPGAGAGGGGAAATASPPREMVAAPPPPPPTPTVDPSQIVTQVPVATPVTSLTVRVNDTSRSFNQANPTFGFSIVSGSLAAGHNLITGFLTPATLSSPVAGSPYSVNFSNPRIVDGTGADVTSRYNLTTLGGILNILKASQVLSFNPVSPRLTGSSGQIPVLGVQVGTASFSVLETDGRASVDSLGNVSVGKILGATSFTLRVAAGADGNYLAAQKDLTVNIARNIPAVEAANPVRQLFNPPSGVELAALDEFFYFEGKAAGYTGGPDRLFNEPGLGDTDRILAAPGASIQTHATQSYDLFAARKFTQGSGTVAVSPASARTERVQYATTIDLGAANPRWQGLVDPLTQSTSLGSLYRFLNADYLPVFTETIDPVSGEPAGFVNSFGALLAPLANFPVWDDAGGALGSVDALRITLTGLDAWTLMAGSGGLAARGVDLDANGARTELMTTGDLKLASSRLGDISSGGGTVAESLVLEARGKVKLGADGAANLDLPTNAGLADEQQVRLEGRTDSLGNALAGSLAVVRTGDSLELRNVTVRGFSETRLEKRNPTTRALEGRVLISGSAVRDFKIKELVGAAVNADAKIQMMALDANGALAGDMVVEGKMPVQAKVASALAAAGETLPAATANAMVDARQIDLAARNLKFENANLVVMNAITARASTILIQNSFMTVVRNQGMVNLYVQSGLVNQNFGTQVAGRVNFDGLNKFQIGSNYFEIGNQAQLTSAYGTNLLDFTQNGGTPQAGKVNVLRL